MKFFSYNIQWAALYTVLQALLDYRFIHIILCNTVSWRAPLASVGLTWEVRPRQTR